jgi:K+-sensing histidine kinase KdpD
VAENVIATANLTLIFVLPVVIAAATLGLGPALLASVVGVAAFDFFFTVPLMSLRIASPADIWAAALLLAIGAVVASIAGLSRRRAIEAQQAANREAALQKLAHIVVEQRSPQEILDAAAATLRRIFCAPAVVFLNEGGTLRRAATAGDPKLTSRDEEAARGAMTAQVHTRARMYPYDEARFEFWPVPCPTGPHCVLGVDFTRADAERPDEPELFTDVVAAYVAIALRAPPRRARAARPEADGET